METTQEPVNRSIDRQNVAGAHDGILLSPEKERNSDLGYHILELQKHDTRSNKPQIRGQMWCDSTYTQHLQ